MISRKTLAVVGLVTLLTGALGAQPQANPSTESPRAETKQDTKEKMQGSGMMRQMMMECEKIDKEISQLLGNLKGSAAAMKNERDSAVLQTALAEHAALLDTLDAKLSERKSMMEKMDKMEMMMDEMGDGAKKDGKSSK